MYQSSQICSADGVGVDSHAYDRADVAVVQASMANSRGSMAAAAACLALALAASVTDAKPQHTGFIRMQDGKFVDQECREFNFVGANA